MVSILSECKVVKKKKKRKETPLVNFLKIVYNFQALKFHLLFKFVLFNDEYTNNAFVISGRYNEECRRLRGLSVFSGHRNSLILNK